MFIRIKTFYMLSITLIQSSLQWENTDANLAMFQEKIESLHKKSHIILLPEMFNTGFTTQSVHLAETMDGKTVEWMKTMAIKKKAIISGSVMIKEDNKIFNRLIWMLPNGEYYTYDKRHLFSYADEDQLFSPGQKRLIASVNGWKLNLQICYDLRFPVWARQSYGVEPEYDVLVYVANWPDKRNHAWKSLLVARAIENQCYVIGVNIIGTYINGQEYSGHSMVIDPLGEILYNKADKEDIYTFTLDKANLNHDRNRFPFLLDGDNFTLRHK